MLSIVTANMYYFGVLFDKVGGFRNFVKEVTVSVNAKSDPKTNDL